MLQDSENSSDNTDEAYELLCKQYYENNNVDSLIVVAEEIIDEVEFDLVPLPRKSMNSQKPKI